MISSRRRAWVLATLAGISFSLIYAAEKPKSRKPPRLPDVLVVGDAAIGTTPEVTRPAPGKPIRYLVIGGARKDLGDPVPDVQAPDEPSVRRELKKALASQGYVEVQPGGQPPQIAILYSWGTANLVTVDADELLPPPPEDVEGAFPQDPIGVVWFNGREINQLIGADKAEGHLMSSVESDELNSAFRDDRVYVVVAALDFEAAKRKERRLLWRTRLSIDWRDAKPDSLDVMFKSAAPYFGVNTDRGVFVDDTLRRKAEVKIGETRVIEDQPETTPRPEKTKP